MCTLLQNLICFSALFCMVSGLGFFSVNIDKLTSRQNFRNENGTCCAGGKSENGVCSEPCNLRVRICLHIYLNTVPSNIPRNKCVYWERFTPILGESSLYPRDQEFKQQMDMWAGSFLLIMEVYHSPKEVQNDSNSPSNSDVLMTRKVVAEPNYKSNSSWKTITMSKVHVQLVFNYRFECAHDYHGARCRKFCKPRNDSHGHYNCDKDGERVCLPGYHGVNCHLPICSGGCQNGGACVAPGKCECPIGWEGASCGQCRPLPGCSVNGYCEKAGECKCRSGYGGMFCNVDLNWCTRHSNPCKNQGTCLNKKSNANFNYTCDCPPGFSGPHCERFVEKCALHTCQNGGSCEKDAEQCSCASGYYGPLCQFNQTTCSDQPCQGRGRCTPTAAGFRCHCDEGLRGRNCEVNIDDCAVNPCKNGGLCVDQVSGYMCVCPLGYKGPQCQVNQNDCRELSCLNGGTCQDRANRVECACSAGFSGPRCEANINDCLDQPCRNGGVCHDGNNDFTCTCAADFAGKRCEFNSTDPCAGQPCRNGGQCAAGAAADELFRCSCTPGYTGPTCDTVAATSSPVRGAGEPQDDGLSPVELLLIALLGIVIPVLVILIGVFVYTWRKHQRRLDKSRPSPTATNNQEIRNKLSSAEDHPDLCVAGAGLVELPHLHKAALQPIMGTVSAKVNNQMRNNLLKEHDVPHYLRKGGVQVQPTVPVSHSFPASLCSSHKLLQIPDSIAGSTSQQHLGVQVQRRPPPPPILPARSTSTVLTLGSDVNLCSTYQDAYVTEV